MKHAIEAGLFETVEHAKDAVSRCLEAGISHDRISVVCSDERKAELVEVATHEHVDTHEPGKANQPLVGGVVGAILGGVIGVPVVVATGGAGLVAVGPVLGGAVAGTLLGQFLKRGIEDETARFYDQGVASGQILVTVEGPPEELERAKTAFAEAGARPFELEEG